MIKYEYIKMMYAIGKEKEGKKGIAHEKGSKAQN